MTTQPSKPLDDPIDEILKQDPIQYEGKSCHYPHPMWYEGMKIALLKWRSDYVMGLIGEDEYRGSKLFKPARNQFRAELRRKLKGGGE